MAVSGVRVEGLNKTVRALQSFGVEVADLKEVFSEISQEGARLASGYAPKKSGRLSGTVRGNKAKNKAVVIAGRARVPYAGAINYGWPVGKRKWDSDTRRSGGYPIGIRASLFMQKADADLAPRAVQMLEAGLDEVARKAGLDVG